MAKIIFALGPPIKLNQLLPENAGVPVALPLSITHAQGIYLILNQQLANPKENRYMGISTDLRKRFASRQGSCFELGFSRITLDDILAFLGKKVSYQNFDDMHVLDVGAYGPTDMDLVLDGHTYDLEHIFIKAAQHAWPYGTITNTQKTGVLINQGAHPIDVSISWEEGGLVNVSLPSGGRWD